MIEGIMYPENSTLPNLHPGEVLREEFLEPLKLTASQLARDLGLSQTRIAAILHERRAINADTAMRLARYFGTKPEFWLHLQTRYDLEEMRRGKSAIYEAIPVYTQHPLTKQAA